jgi:hypothetical protein
MSHRYNCAYCKAPIADRAKVLSEDGEVFFFHLDGRCADSWELRRRNAITIANMKVSEEMQDEHPS